MTRTRIALALLVAATLAPARPAAAKPIAWHDWTSGFREAGAASRPVLVDVYTDWCAWCRRMEHDVYSRSDVRDYLAEHFVAVRLNAESDAAARYQGKRYTLRTLAARFRVTSYPTTMFLRPDGQHIVNVPGYVPADHFLLVMRYIADGHMDRGVSYEDFVREQAGDR